MVSDHIDQVQQCVVASMVSTVDMVVTCTAVQVQLQVSLAQTRKHFFGSVAHPLSVTELLCGSNLS